jgi:mannose-6-phosphate isomerase
VLIPLTNTARDYSWGSTELLPALQGRASSGRPEAEIWFGDHPGSPAHVPDGRTLPDVLAARGDAPLPYLVKLLAAGSSLSIQAHPSKGEAEAGFAREEAAGIPRNASSRTYRDDNHKPEIIVALSETFRALVGLRPLAQTRRLLAVLGEPARPIAERLAGPDEAAALRGVLAWVLGGTAGDEVEAVSSALVTASDDEFAAELEVLRRIAADFPGDPGIVVALLMNLVVLRRGEALYAPAGALHAYQDGLGVEVMAASDNVLRGGLTPKHVDVAELLRLVDTTPGPPPLVPPASADGVDLYDVGIPDFRVRRVRTDAGASRTLAVSGPAVVVVTDGAVTLSAGSASAEIAAGSGGFLTADEAELTLRGAGETFLAEPGGGRDTPTTPGEASIRG